MKKDFRSNDILLIVIMVLTVLLYIACAGKASRNNLVLHDAAPNNEVPLVLQTLDYTENPVDIPNPDRGFYRPQSYVIPVESEPVPNLPDLTATITGTSVSVESRIVYMEFDLRNFSSNA